MTLERVRLGCCAHAVIKIGELIIEEHRVQLFALFRRISAQCAKPLIIHRPFRVREGETPEMELQTRAIILMIQLVCICGDDALRVFDILFFLRDDGDEGSKPRIVQRPSPRAGKHHVP